MTWQAEMAIKNLTFSKSLFITDQIRSPCQTNWSDSGTIFAVYLNIPCISTARCQQIHHLEHYGGLNLLMWLADVGLYWVLIQIHLIGRLPLPHSQKIKGICALLPSGCEWISWYWSTGSCFPCFCSCRHSGSTQPLLRQFSALCEHSHVHHQLPLITAISAHLRPFLHHVFSLVPHPFLFTCAFLNRLLS